MTATKMNALKIIQFIANAEKKTSVKVTFVRGNSHAVCLFLLKLVNVLYGETGRMWLRFLKVG